MFSLPKGIREHKLTMSFLLMIMVFFSLGGYTRAQCSCKMRRPFFSRPMAAPGGQPVQL